MDSRIISKAALDAFVDKLGGTHAVLAPVKGKDGLSSFAKAGPGLTLPESGNTAMPAKSLAFPQSETLLRFDNTRAEGGLVFREEPAAGGLTAVIGVRPCDAKALALFDAIFSRDPQSHDPYWARRREATAIIGLACNHPCPACFCSQVGSGPHEKTGMDVLLTDLGESYLAEPVSSRGAQLLDGLPEAFAEDLKRAAELKNEAEAALRETLPMDGIEAGSVLDLCALPLWEELAATCLNCGACTFVCPTCHCFDIQDETKGRSGRRIRNWDSCMSSLFTRHASGHNPRGAKADRIRQRFMHKLKYIPMKRALVGCVGCGRCVTACPVNIDIREVARAMNAAMSGAAK